MTIKQIILILQDLQKKYGNLSVERLMEIESIPFYVKRKERKNNKGEK